MHRILLTVAESEERQLAQNRRLRSALIYPTLVFLSCLVLLVLAPGLLLSRQVTLLQDLGIQLPWVTKLLMGTASLASSPYCWATGLALIAALSMRKGLLLRVVRSYETALRRAPGFREVFKAIFLTQFFRALALQLRAGMALLESLTRAFEMIDQPAMRERGARIVELISEGEELNSSLADSGLFPRMAVALVRVGEETGKLEEICFSLVDFYQEEFNRKIDTALAMLEPVLIMTVGVITGACLLITMYPMVKALQSL